MLLVFPLSGELREAHRKASDKVITEVLGKGELSELGSVNGKEYFLHTGGHDNSGSYVVFSSATGRFDNFDYMVIVDPSFQIVNIKILKYRSEYGYEISNKGWLKQFYGKKTEPFSYRQNIDALAGATYSARSLTEDINLILEKLKEY